MTYHIPQIDNQSDRSVALTNPLTGTSKRDCVLILPKTLHKPDPAPEVNKIEGNPTYTQATKTALNIYTKTDNYCFWDNTNSACDWRGGKKHYGNRQLQCQRRQFEADHQPEWDDPVC
jgi:hypothetical protein